MKITGVRWAESSRRKVSHGEITFADKKAKKVAEKDFSDLGFRSTPQGGGGATFRQYRKQTHGRDVLQDAHHNGQSNN